ncbi:hypothetical protein Mic7113_2132 [Allocoleopsis franciscana PCC 7113]|uniref:STAS domain-containing protein n=2 Tax=Allocoleopsis TaxID=2886347 RepID=K9WCH8_9CYAN|nr:hypothetical protein Mic7113_2132 [Allocoleopsis franciscana PCC 7113]
MQLSRLVYSYRYDLSISEPLTSMTESAELEVKDNEYCVRYHPETKTITFQGELQLSGMDEYAPIMSLLDEVVNQEPPVLTLDLRKLEFLNSSGVNVLLSLVIKVRDKKTMQLMVEGSENIFWQSRSLNNIKRLMPTAQLNFT